MRNKHRLIVRAILFTVIMVAWLRSGSAQTKELINGQSGAENQSSVEMSKQAANPLASLSLMQFQQNTNWVGLPSNQGEAVQSNLQFQPLLPVSMTENWNLIARPVLQMYNSTPYVSPNRQVNRETGFGDTVLAFALSPGHSLVGNWLLAAGPTFILPTATETLIGQKKWQFGPTVAVGYAGKHFLTYVFTQQWFPIGGSGQKTNQMATYYSFVYFFSNGWSVGTTPQMLVNWEARRTDRVTFPVGIQIGKLRTIGPLPVKLDLMVQFYPVHPDVNSPKWNLQLQVTSIVSKLIKRTLF